MAITTEILSLLRRGFVKISNLVKGTAGDMIYWDSNGKPQALPIGTTDQILKVSGGVPIWGTDAGGAWELVSTANITSPVSEVTFTTGITADKTHIFIFESVESDTGGRPVVAEFKTASSTNNVGYAAETFNDVGSESFFGNGSLSQATILNSSSNGVSGKLLLSTADNTNDYFSGTWSFAHKPTTTTGANLVSGAFLSVAKNITLDEVRFAPTAGTLDSGRIHHLRLVE